MSGFIVAGHEKTNQDVTVDLHCRLIQAAIMSPFSSSLSSTDSVTN